ncbi:hypothetical protein [Vibrio mediterranei]|uniref:hypothetical protein n=1 Tax=Vibrio mediterranei TaxID=689 RepID=UPI004067F623
MNTPRTKYGHRLGQTIECLTSGSIGVIKSIRIDLVGCEFFFLHGLTTDEKTEHHEFSCSSVTTEIINDAKVDEYEAIFKKHCPNGVMFKNGQRVKSIASEQSGIIVSTQIEFSGDIFYFVELPWTEERALSGEERQILCTQGELELVDDGVVEQVEAMRAKRADNELPFPQSFDVVRSLVSGLEGCVIGSTKLINGTVHLLVQPENSHNRKFASESIDIELLEVLGEHEEEIKDKMQESEPKNGCFHLPNHRKTKSLI